jgi:hypothetical protein
LGTENHIAKAKAAINGTKLVQPNSSGASHQNKFDAHFTKNKLDELLAKNKLDLLFAKKQT